MEIEDETPPDLVDVSHIAQPEENLENKTSPPPEVKVPITIITGTSDW